MAEIRALQDVAAAVRGRRHALKLTQTALASTAGVSRTFIADLEAGKLTVELRSVLAVLEALGYTLDLVVSDEGDPAKDREPMSAEDDLDLDDILAAYDQGR